MPALSIFPTDALRVYADLIHGQLGVRVVIKGREIMADLKRKTIYLPNLEGASEDDLRPILGFALHEAAHIRWTRVKALRGIDSFLLKDVANWIEDNFIEAKLCSRLPGARERLRYSHENGYAALVRGEAKKDGDGKPLTLFRTSDRGYLNDPDHLREMMAEQGRRLVPKGGNDEDAHAAMLKAVRERLKMLGLPDAEADALRELAKRYEISWFLWLWSCEWRDFSDKRVRQLFHNHPWRPVLEKITRTKARNSMDCLAQARTLIKALDVHPVLPWDCRPPAVEARREAAAARTSARAARRSWRRARRRIGEEAEKRTQESAEAQAHVEKAEAVAEAQAKVAEAERATRRARELLEGKRELLERTRQRLAGKPETPERKRPLERRETAVQEAEKGLAGAEAGLRLAAAKLAIARSEEQRARRERAAVYRAIRKELMQQEKTALDALKRIAEEKEQAATEAEEKARKLCEEARRGDEEVGAVLDKETLKQVLREVLRRLRSTTVEEELGDAMPGDEGDEETPVLVLRAIPGAERAKMPAPPKPETALSAKRYLPFDRSQDTIERVLETPEAASEYAAARAKYERIITESLAHLRRLYSPSLTRLKVNADAGRLDPRQAHRIGLALRGAAVDLSRVWRRLEVRRDPKIAISLLVDCSGSMSGDKIGLARASACCLSEVMRQLNVPHEIVGHTTCDGLAPSEVSKDDRRDYSRFVPFRGYVFKEFRENRTPTSLYAPFDMESNLDGEAVMWALTRLAARPEKTKICVVLSDSLPMASLSDTGELERHLYTVCKRAEAHQENGLFLIGLGIAVKRVREFYRNAVVLNAVDGLPKAVLGIVESVLGQMAGLPVKEQPGEPEPKDEGDGDAGEEEEEESLLAWLA